MAVGPLSWPLLVLGVSTGVIQDSPCPTAANPLVESAWNAYRIAEFDSARVRFEAATESCPDHTGARIGLAYATMQTDRLERARSLFREALALEPDNIDALLGSGLVAWRSDSISRAETIFQQVLELQPENTTAREFLGRTGRILGTPPPRPRYERPDSTIYFSRTHGTHFDVRTDSGWGPFYINGINLGTALPGKFATEFPDSITYATWIEQIGAMRANVIRVYTIHPPRFYQALWEYNTTHAEPLWLVHGAWATVPPNDDYDNATWNQEFFDEVHDVVDLIHGRADLPPKADEGFRHYTSDISRWVVAFVFGREWEPHTVANFNRENPGRDDWSGDFVGVSDGTALEVWMAQASDEMVSYEMRRYNTQRPVAFTNWPTLDPLTHKSEASNAQEVAILTGMGTTAYLNPDASNQDDQALDASRMFSTNQFRAGHFASYHAYPYHPDFMILDPLPNDAITADGPSHYYAYLRKLAQHHDDVPVLIAEYGVPASMGIAHLQPQGQHHGGHTEQRQAEINVRLTRDIAASGMAGGILFSWIDEWFKKTWLLAPMTLPEMRNRLWLNRLDPEQHYGVIAMEPIARLPGVSLPDRLTSWQQIEPLYDTDTATLRASPDEAYLSLLIEQKSPTMADELFVGFDMLDRTAGDHRWPDATGPRVPVGLEFVLRISGTRAEILADSGANPWSIVPIHANLAQLRSKTELDLLDELPDGAFSGRWQANANVPFLTAANEDGAYTPLRVVVRRHRVSPDTTEHPAVGYNRGLLPKGAAPSGMWEISEEHNAIEIRIPWMLLNVTDPSSRHVLKGADHTLGPYRSEPVSDIRIVAAMRSGLWSTFPRDGGTVSAFTWDRWERPQWRARPKPLYRAMQRVFGDLLTPATSSGH